VSLMLNRRDRFRRMYLMLLSITQVYLRGLHTRGHWGRGKEAMASTTVYTHRSPRLTWKTPHMLAKRVALLQPLTQTETRLQMSPPVTPFSPGIPPFDHVSSNTFEHDATDY
jgi:hypothetical protein